MSAKLEFCKKMDKTISANKTQSKTSRVCLKCWILGDPAPNAYSLLQLVVKFELKISRKLTHRNTYKSVMTDC